MLDGGIMLNVSIAGTGSTSDVIHTRRGERVRLRVARPADADALQAYVRALSTRSRHSRFFGALSELPKPVLDDFVKDDALDRVTLLATMVIDGAELIVGEARYVRHADDACVEFGLSVDDRWQGHGIGPAMMAALESRAAALGAHGLFGDTLRTNAVMLAVAKAAGFTLRQHPHDWTLVRFEKKVGRVAADDPALRLVASSRPD